MAVPTKKLKTEFGTPAQVGVVAINPAVIDLSEEAKKRAKKYE